MKPMPIIGWDVGGAHLKAVLLDAQGNVEQVVQAPCPLWQGLHMLEQAIEEVLKKFNLSSALHAITMTGELVDLFASRQSGVYEISRVMHARLNGHKN